MNLYRFMFDHYSPKDSQRGIVTYILADTDEEVYEWFKSEPTIKLTSDMLFNSWKYYEEEREYDVWDDKFNIIGTETFKERMLRLGGEMFDDEAEVSDAYYGVTHYGWELHKENIDNLSADVLVELGIAIKIK